jgi:hypothetical protein
VFEKRAVWCSDAPGLWLSPPQEQLGDLVHVLVQAAREEVIDLVEELDIAATGQAHGQRRPRPRRRRAARRGRRPRTALASPGRLVLETRMAGGLRGGARASSAQHDLDRGVTYATMCSCGGDACGMPTAPLKRNGSAFCWVLFGWQTPNLFSEARKLGASASCSLLF